MCVCVCVCMIEIEKGMNEKIENELCVFLFTFHFSSHPFDWWLIFPFFTICVPTMCWKNVHRTILEIAMGTTIHNDIIYLNDNNKFSMATNENGNFAIRISEPHQPPMIIFQRYNEIWRKANKISVHMMITFACRI